MIYIDAVNEFGTKGGSESYLIDLTFSVIPIFLKNLTDLSIPITRYQKDKIIFNLPKVSVDVTAIKIKKSINFPYLTVNLTSLIIDPTLVKKNDFGLNFITL